MTTFVFIITLLAPVFGASIEIPIQTSAAEAEVAREACWKVRRAAQTMLRDQPVPARVSECAEVTK